MWHDPGISPVGDSAGGGNNQLARLIGNRDWPRQSCRTMFFFFSGTARFFFKFFVCFRRPIHTSFSYNLPMASANDVDVIAVGCIMQRVSISLKPLGSVTAEFKSCYYVTKLGEQMSSTALGKKYKSKRDRKILVLSAGLTTSFNHYHELLLFLRP